MRLPTRQWGAAFWILWTSRLRSWNTSWERWSRRRWRSSSIRRTRCRPTWPICDGCPAPSDSAVSPALAVTQNSENTNPILLARLVFLLITILSCRWRRYSASRIHSKSSVPHNRFSTASRRILRVSGWNLLNQRPCAEGIFIIVL